ncbi:tetrapeptide repeat homeobox protein 2-like [Neofelis nebulosa]|uniref:tetrapeptide repeat homeobox protein 2-like n=1 Tax=Neofelis nebulosa TaxID=61452 RepID=UPI00272B9CC1|nr:tetrapeptide repeat homeobox protein 2-like [Neofelis nebulosa]
MLPERKEHGGALTEDQQGPRAITGATCLSTRPVQDLGGDSEKGPEGERGVGGQRGGSVPPTCSSGPGPARGRVFGGRGAVCGACLSPFLLGSGPPSARTLPRPRKKRTVYLKEQLQELEKHFWANRYPSYQERVALAAGLNLDEHQVQVWFKNRRAKHSRLPKGRGRGAHMAPRDPGAPNSRSVPAPVAESAPVPESVPVPFPVPAPFPAPVPAGPMFPGTPGVRSPALHGPSRMHPAAEPGTCSLDPAWWAPERGSQESVPAPAPAWPQNSFGADFVPDPLLAPSSTAVFSPQDPLEGPSGPVMSGYQEEEGPAEDDSELMTLLNL